MKVTSRFPILVLLFTLSLLGVSANASAEPKGKNPPGPQGGPGAGPRVGGNPPGPKGGPGAGGQWQGGGNPPGPQGGPGAGPRWKDNPNKIDNPPGPQGGPGTDWQRQNSGEESGSGQEQSWQRGEQFGRGSEFLKKADVNQDGVIDDAERSRMAEQFREQNQLRHEKFKEKADKNQDGIVDDAERKAALELMREKNGNPPGPQGGPGAGPRWNDSPYKVDNPPGPQGGPGTDWNKGWKPKDDELKSSPISAPDQDSQE